MTIFLIKSYLIQTQVLDPHKLLGAGHRVFLPTLNGNNFKYNNIIFRRRETAFVGIYKLGFGVRCIGLVLIYCNDLMLKTVFIIIILKTKQYEKGTKIYTSTILVKETYPLVR